MSMPRVLSYHTGEQRQTLRDGLNIAFLGFGITLTALILGVGLSILGFESVGRWVGGLGVTIFGSIGAFGLTTGLAGYFNDEVVEEDG